MTSNICHTEHWWIFFSNNYAQCHDVEILLVYFQCKYKIKVDLTRLASFITRVDCLSFLMSELHLLLPCQKPYILTG